MGNTNYIHIWLIDILLKRLALELHVNYISYIYILVVNSITLELLVNWMLCEQSAANRLI